MIDSTLSGIVWFEVKAGVVEEVGRPPHVSELSLPVLQGCLGEAETPPSVGRGTPLSWVLFQRPGICMNHLGLCANCSWVYLAWPWLRGLRAGPFN